MGKRFVASVRDGHDLLIRPARAERAWMDAHLDGHGYRCLPMRIANQHGWEIGSPVAFTAIWNGGAGQDCLAILPDEPSDRIRSHFGGGIFSVLLPAVFRLEPGYDLVVQGPPNLPVRGASPLSGIVEADWLVSAVSMHWQMTEPNRAVRFRKGDPLCQVFPVRRAEIEEFAPELRRLSDEPELAAALEDWTALRHDLRQALKDPDAPAARKRWPQQYRRGEDIRGRPAAPDSHRTQLRPRPFADQRTPAVPDAEG
jgi:hypothetical protein